MEGKLYLKHEFSIKYTDVTFQVTCFCSKKTRVYWKVKGHTHGSFASRPILATMKMLENKPLKIHLPSLRFLEDDHKDNHKAKGFLYDEKKAKLKKILQIHKISNDMDVYDSWVP